MVSDYRVLVTWTPATESLPGIQSELQLCIFVMVKWTSVTKSKIRSLLTFQMQLIPGLESMDDEFIRSGKYLQACVFNINLLITTKTFLSEF